MMRPTRHYTDGPFGQIHFQQLGDGAPLLLLHQVPMTAAQFDNVYAPLAARGIRAIGIDMPGFGMSDPTDFVPTIGDYAKVIPAVLDTLSIAQADALGHHTGAEVVTEAGIAFPDRIRKLILNGPLPITEEERQDYLANGHQWELAWKALPGGAHMRELFEIRERFAAGTVSSERISDYVVQALMGKSVFWYGHHAAFQYRHDEAMLKVTQPALILTNTGDIIYPLAVKAHAIRPDFAFVALEGGGVDIVDQQPEEWADAVAAFLHECER